ncbi:MAG: AAA family ATPase [Chloroflexia bacterium]
MARVARPFIFVLAGVNGAGKSSVGGALLAEHGLTWFNPDSYARELGVQLGLDASESNGRAWQYGHERLKEAVAAKTSFAFETTLGARTIPELLARAAATHDVAMIFCGLATPELHIARVQFRVAHGGHAIPATKIRERWTTSRANLIRLLPALARLQVFDNSADAGPDGDIPDPVLVLEMAKGRVLFSVPDDAKALAVTPGWARSIVQAAFEVGR